MPPRHKPTPEQRRQVEAMAGFGVPQEDVAAVLGIDSKTLRLHYREELDTASAKANARVAQSLFQMATSGNVAAAIFWMKARGGWKETSRNELVTVADIENALKGASDDEIRQHSGVDDSGSGSG